MEKVQAWWDFEFDKIGGYKEKIQYEQIKYALSKLAIQNKKTLDDYYKKGSLKSNITFEQFHSFFIEKGAYLYARNKNNTEYNGPTYTYAWNESVLYIDYSSEGEENLEINFSSTNIDLFQSICNFIGNSIETEVSAGKVYMLAQREGSFYLSSIGLAACALEKNNYTSDTIEKYEHIVTDLKSSKPCGRVIILDGLPGGGKTFLVKGLLNDVPNAKFIIVPSSYITQLSSPVLIPILLKQQSNGIPLILILEDSDDALNSRMTDNMDSISTILNFGAGLLGDLLDVRIIMTTNMSIKNVDKAIVREGRLCRRVDIKKLDKEHAYAIYKRLTNKESEKFTEKEYTLAQVYLMARNDGYLPEETQKIGFVKKDFCIEDL